MHMHWFPCDLTIAILLQQCLGEYWTCGSMELQVMDLQMTLKVRMWRSHASLRQCIVQCRACQDAP